MADNYKHLRFEREEPVTPKRGRPFFRPPVPPENPKEHGKQRLTELRSTVAKADMNVVKGFDDRYLVKVQVSDSLRPEDLEKLGVELVSQESEHVLLAFATKGQLEVFEARLSTIMRGGQAEKQDLFYAMEAFDNWTPEDRTGWALGQEGVPDEGTFLIDIEMWPLGTVKDRERLMTAFKSWATENKMDIIDSIDRPSLAMFRLRATKAKVERLLLWHRDIRTVDLPPRYGFKRTMFHIDIDEIPTIAAPPQNAPGVVILDTGVQSSHPLLSSAFGDGHSFLDDGDGDTDVEGHGTSVAGIALYGDVKRCLDTRNFAPTFWIFSARVLDDNRDNESGFLENQVEEAVEYFVEEYNCRVFNLSLVDERKPYDGRHVRGLAVMLDNLARKWGVLFIVSTGNFENCSGDWADDYPKYLSEDGARLQDPATALNVLTVGSIARWDMPHSAQMDPNDATIKPIARKNQPSPFTRSGPTVGGAIKPELVDYGGNKYIRTGMTPQMLFDDGLGEISTVRTDFGRLLGAECGTSLAAPRVSHYATAFLTEFPDATNDLIRAVLAASARHPEPCKVMYPKGPDLTTICGYGQVDEVAFLRSTQNIVTMLTEDYIENKQHHFYELPIPVEFFSGAKRNRELTVALAYTPAVRTDRIAYRASRMFFHLVEEDSLEDVVNAFNKETDKEDFPNIRELSGNRNISSQARNRGTLQSSTWSFVQPTVARRSKKLFLVVTRNDFPWAADLCATRERYALVVNLNDRALTDAELYTQVTMTLSNQVKQRQEARAQNRVRV